MKNKMKKTIAILLVLVIGMVGVFAADAKLDIKADVSAQSLIKITTISDGAYDFNDFVYATFGGLDDVVESDAVIGESNFQGKVKVGHLNYWSNQPSGLSTTVSATILKDRTEDTTNTSRIGYTVFVGDTKVVEILNSEESKSGVENALDLITANTATSSFGSKLIEVQVNANDYRLALASDEYTATITFNYTAN